MNRPRRTGGKAGGLVGRYLLLSGILAAVSACANLPRGGQESVRFLSDPEGALATTNKNASCLTPCTLQFSRFEDFQVTFTKDGFASQTVNVASILGAGRADGIAIAPGIRFGLAERNTLSDAGANFRRQLLPNPVFVKLAPAQ